MLKAHEYKKNIKKKSRVGIPPRFKALCKDDSEQNAGPIHASNPEHLHVFKGPRGDNPEQNAGTIYASYLEHLLVLKT